MDLIDIAVKLRELMSACDTAEDTLGGSFVKIDPELEALATQLRPVVDDTGALALGFLERLERHPKFMKQRRHILDRRLSS